MHLNNDWKKESEAREKANVKLKVFSSITCRQEDVGEGSKSTNTCTHTCTWRDLTRLRLRDLTHTEKREREKGKQKETEKYESQSWCKALLHSLQMPLLSVSDNKQNPKPNLGIYIKTVGAGGFPLNDTQEIPNMKTLNSDILKHWFLCFGWWRFDA